MDKQLIEIFNKIIDKKYKKTNHKIYYSNEYYLINIFEMLNDINKWETLKKLKSYNPVIINGKESKNHYSTIRKKFNKWCNDGIFEMAFQECIDKTKLNQLIKLSIDASFINNKYGIEEIALNVDNKKRGHLKFQLFLIKINLYIQFYQLKSMKKKKKR